MKQHNLPIDIINRVLDREVFKVHPFGDITPIKVNVKFKINGVTTLFDRGDPSEYITYTLYILPTDEVVDSILKVDKIMPPQIKLTTKSDEFLRLRWDADRTLSNFLRLFNLKLPTTCVEIINLIGMERVNESVLKESKYDGITRQFVRDIIKIVKKRTEGEYILPEDLYPEQVFYEFENMDSSLQIYVNIVEDELIDDFSVDGDYYRDDEEIHITITLGPSFSSTSLSSLMGDLNELIRHELEHVKQFNSGYKFPKKEPKDPEKYYTQKHELEAQRAGFKRRSKKEKKDYESVVRDWFEKNKNKHSLSPDQMERVIRKVLNSL